MNCNSFTQHKISKDHPKTTTYMYNVLENQSHTHIDHKKKKIAGLSNRWKIFPRNVQTNLSIYQSKKRTLSSFCQGTGCI